MKETIGEAAKDERRVAISHDARAPVSAPAAAAAIAGTTRAIETASGNLH